MNWNFKLLQVAVDLQAEKPYNIQTYQTSTVKGMEIWTMTMRAFDQKHLECTYWEFEWIIKEKVASGSFLCSRLSYAAEFGQVTLNNLFEFQN